MKPQSPDADDARLFSQICKIMKLEPADADDAGPSFALVKVQSR